MIPSHFGLDAIPGHASSQLFSTPNFGPIIPGFLSPLFRKPKRIRTAFSPGQLLKLEHAFEKNHYGKFDLIIIKLSFYYNI